MSLFSLVSHSLKKYDILPPEHLAHEVKMENLLKEVLDNKEGLNNDERGFKMAKGGDVNTLDRYIQIRPFINHPLELLRGSVKSHNIELTRHIIDNYLTEDIMDMLDHLERSREVWENIVIPYLTQRGTEYEMFYDTNPSVATYVCAIGSRAYSDVRYIRENEVILSRIKIFRAGSLSALNKLFPDSLQGDGFWAIYEGDLFDLGFGAIESLAKDLLVDDQKLIEFTAGLAYSNNIGLFSKYWERLGNLVHTSVNREYRMSESSIDNEFIEQISDDIVSFGACDNIDYLLNRYPDLVFYAPNFIYEDYLTVDIYRKVVERQIQQGLEPSSISRVYVGMTGKGFFRPDILLACYELTGTKIDPVYSGFDFSHSIRRQVEFFENHPEIIDGELTWRNFYIYFEDHNAADTVAIDDDDFRGFKRMWQEELPNEMLIRAYDNSLEIAAFLLTIIPESEREDVSTIGADTYGVTQAFIDRMLTMTYFSLKTMLPYVDRRRLLEYLQSDEYEKPDHLVRIDKLVELLS